MSYTTNDLLDLIEKRVFTPINQNTLDKADILNMATDELRSIIVPAILSAREEWYVVKQSYANTVIDQDVGIPIPTRAIGGALREVASKQYGNMPRRSLEDVNEYSVNGDLTGFYLQGNNIKFFGSDNSDIEVYYHCRPGKLVETSLAANVGSFDLSTRTITSGSVPNTWVTGTKVDIIHGKPHFDHKSVSLTISSVVNGVITFNEDLPTNLEVGDWVSLEDTSPVPQIPVDWFPYLAQATAVQILESLGDFEAANYARGRQEKLHKHAMQLLTPRVQGEPKKVVPSKNRYNSLNNFWSE